MKFYSDPYFGDEENGQRSINNLIKFTQLVSLNQCSQVPALMFLKLGNTVVLLPDFCNNEISKIQSDHYLPKYIINEWKGF